MRLSWATAPRLTLLAGIVQLLSGCVTAFGLFATANALTGVRNIAEVTSTLVSLTAAVVTTGLLSPWLVPVLLLATAADAWAAMTSAKLGYRSFLNMVTRHCG
ncbi:hypothetical protein [Saccharopolyspora sp. ASAGF58]|uniref:hypothetical protein n=1 Tax=Saccharopolyspora sp. ASAGF58 TaxID=2719023 RepID=UPI001FF0C370|nr:hypothetical protein [Saccharopolyspora sp. ASAGF58]